MCHARGDGQKPAGHPASSKTTQAVTFKEASVHGSKTVQGPKTIQINDFARIMIYASGAGYRQHSPDDSVFVFINTTFSGPFGGSDLHSARTPDGLLPLPFPVLLLPVTVPATEHKTKRADQPGHMRRPATYVCLTICARLALARLTLARLAPGRTVAKPEHQSAGSSRQTLPDTHTEQMNAQDKASCASYDPI